MSALFELRQRLNEYRQLWGAGLWSLVLRIVGLGSSFLLGVVLARVLGPAEFGTYGLVISVAMLIMNVVLVGTPQLAVREFAVRSERNDWTGVLTLARAFTRATFAMSIAVLVIAAGAELILRPGDSTGLVITILGALLTSAMSFTALAAAELRGLGRMVQGQFMDIVGRPLAAFVLIGAALLVGMRLNATLAIAVQLGVAVAAALISFRWLHSAMAATALDSASRPLKWLHLALPLGIVDIVRQLDGTYGVILMGWLASAVDLGIYRVAVGAAVLPAMPLTIIHVVLAPTVSRLYQSGRTEELERLLHRASALGTALLLPMLIGLVLFGRPVVSFVFGPAYEAAALPLILLCAAQLVSGIFGMGPILLAMCDSERHLTLIYLLSVGAGILAAGPLIHSFGAAGAAGAQIVSTGLVSVLSGRFARRRLNLPMTFIGMFSSPRAARGDRH
jgi:O-antigen/teichoic acid export membrane protein